MDEIAQLRNEVFRLHSLISAVTELACTIPGDNPKVERVQALLDVTSRYAADLLCKLEAKSRIPHLATV